MNSTKEFYGLEYFDENLLGLTEVDKSYGIGDRGSLPDIETQNHIKVP